MSNKAKTARTGPVGKNWNWGTLKGAAKVLSDGHLIVRFLMIENGYTADRIMSLCGCGREQMRMMQYGRANRSMYRLHIDMIAGKLGTTYDDLLLNAKKWHAGSFVESMVIHVRSLHDATEGYGFQKTWLEQHQLDPEHLFVIKQDTTMLASEGIQKDDVLLVNRADMELIIGAFYAAEIAGKVWVGMAIRQQGQNCLAVDPSGKRFSFEDFAALQENGHILGRCVWRSALM